MVNLLDYLVIDFITCEMFHHVFISIIQLFQFFVPFLFWKVINLCLYLHFKKLYNRSFISVHFMVVRSSCFFS